MDQVSFYDSCFRLFTIHVNYTESRKTNIIIICVCDGGIGDEGIGDGGIGDGGIGDGGTGDGGIGDGGKGDGGIGVEVLVIVV